MKCLLIFIYLLCIISSLSFSQLTLSSKAKAKVMSFLFLGGFVFFLGQKQVGLKQVGRKQVGLI